MKESICIALICAGSCLGREIVLEGASTTLTTGDLLDEVGYEGMTTNVVEVPGLKITARAAVTNQKINVTSSSLGVTIYGSGDDTDAFDPGESLIFSFNQDVQLDQIDFNGFEAGESFAVSGAVSFVVGYDDLSNQSTDIFNTNVLLAANSEITWYIPDAGSVIGLDGLTVTLPDSSGMPTLSFSSSNGATRIWADFSGAVSTNYVLQSSANLASNDWVTIAGPFAVDTNWLVEPTENAAYFRAVAE